MKILKKVGKPVAKFHDKKQIYCTQKKFKTKIISWISIEKST